MFALVPSPLTRLSQSLHLLFSPSSPSCPSELLWLLVPSLLTALMLSPGPLGLGHPWLLELLFLLAFVCLQALSFWPLFGPPCIFDSLPGVYFLSPPGGSATMQNDSGADERDLFSYDLSLYGRLCAQLVNALHIYIYRIQSHCMYDCTMVATSN